MHAHCRVPGLSRCLVDVCGPVQGGLVVSVEHRYFGESLPFGNESYTNAHLKYLTVANDLAGTSHHTMRPRPVTAASTASGAR